LNLDALKGLDAEKLAEDLQKKIQVQVEALPKRLDKEKLAEEIRKKVQVHVDAAKKDGAAKKVDSAKKADAAKAGEKSGKSANTSVSVQINDGNFKAVQTEGDVM